MPAQSDGAPPDRVGRQGLLRQTTSEAVAAVLRAEIRRGELPPGATLRQQEVAARLGVSTTPVREAFALLQAEGLVRIDAHKGAVVFHPSVSDLRETYEMREALEVLAVAKAVPQLSEDVIDEMELLIERMRTAPHDERWVELNNRFHMVLLEASGRPRLCQMIANLRDSSGAYIHMFVASGGLAELAEREHEQILEACRLRDASAAQKAVRAHMRSTSQAILRFIMRAEEEMGSRA